MEFIAEIKLSGECPAVCKPVSVCHIRNFKAFCFNNVLSLKLVTVHKVGSNGGVSISTDVDAVSVNVVCAEVGVREEIFCFKIGAGDNVKVCGVVVNVVDKLSLNGVCLS